MAYMKNVPDSMKGNTDWVIVAKDEKCFPCHSFPLITASKVFKDLYSTVRTEVDEKTRVPDDAPSAVVENFLAWAYRQKHSFEAAMAYCLAAMAHRLDVPGPHCPALMANAILQA